MHKTKTYQIGVSPERLSEALVESPLAPDLVDPIQALAIAVVNEIRRGPVSLYVCAGDADREMRDQFAALLAKVVARQVPDTLLVDCDFLAVGLSGIVPRYDALGFLDLMLYGSSLGVVRQSSELGVDIIGAGSFPVTRRFPFGIETFVETRRHLTTHCRCVIFCGPALGDSDGPHDLLGAVDTAILVRRGRRARADVLDSLEEKLAAAVDTLWAVRLGADAGATTRTPPAPVTTEPRALWGQPASPTEPEPKRTQPKEPSAPREHEPPVPARRPAAPREERRSPEPKGAAEPELAELDTTAPRPPSSIMPRLLTSMVAVLLVGFLLWWLYLTKSVRERADESLDLPVTIQTEPVDTVQEAATDTSATTSPADVDSTVGVVEVPSGADSTALWMPQPEATDTAAADSLPAPTEETEAIVAPGSSSSADIIVTDHIGRFKGRFVIHVSSFRTLDRARTDAYDLSDQGYPILIAKAHLAEQGDWYRVYVGPFETRDEANAWKIKLDEIPRVKFTSVKQIGN